AFPQGAALRPRCTAPVSEETSVRESRGAAKTPYGMLRLEGAGYVSGVSRLLTDYLAFPAACSLVCQRVAGRRSLLSAGVPQLIGAGLSRLSPSRKWEPHSYSAMRPSFRIALAP